MSHHRQHYSLKKILGLLVLLSLCFNRHSLKVSNNHQIEYNNNEISSAGSNNNATIQQQQQYYVPTLNELNSSISWQEFCTTVQKPNKEFSTFADKHAIKQFIANVTPNLTFSKEYGYVNTPNEITSEFLKNQLPSSVDDKYLMKATHMSGGIVLIETNRNKVQCLKTACDKKDLKRKKNETIVNYLRRRCRYYLNIDYATKKGEMSYANIPRRCIFEEVLDMGTNFQDYKILMFHGKPYIITIMQNRFDQHLSDGNDDDVIQNARKTPYTWKEFPFEDKFDGKRGGNDLVPIRPIFMDDMLQHSKILYDKVKESVPSMVHMRVDFFVYNNGAKYAFAEITFSHSSCKSIFVNNIANQFYGYLATHPNVNIHPDFIIDLRNMTTYG